MKKEVLVFIFDGYTDWEGAYACFELNQPKTEYMVKTLAFDKMPKLSQGGLKVCPNYSIDDYPKDFAMLILVGGEPWIEGKNDRVTKVVEYALAHHIPIAAICNAASFLAEKGLLDEVRHTGNSLAFMKKCAPHYQGGMLFVEQQAVCDGGVITANGTAVLEFTREILRYLRVMPEDQIDEWYRLHKEGFYPAKK